MRIRTLIWAAVLCVLSGALSAAPCLAQDEYLIVAGKFVGEHLEVDGTSVTLDLNQDTGAVGTVTFIPGRISFSGVMRSGTKNSERVRNVPIRLDADATEAERAVHDAITENLEAFNLISNSRDFAGAALELDSGAVLMDTAKALLQTDFDLGLFPDTLTQAELTRLQNDLDRCIVLDQQARDLANGARPNAAQVQAKIRQAQQCKRAVFVRMLKAEPLPPL
jgi:hypothetical protein